MSFEHLSRTLPIRPIRPIRTEADLQQAFARLHDIFQAAEGTANGDERDERDVWVTLIEAFESEHYPFGPGDPVEAIKFRLDQEGLTPRDLEPFTGPQRPGVCGAQPQTAVELAHDQTAARRAEDSL